MGGGLEEASSAVAHFLLYNPGDYRSDIETSIAALTASGLRRSILLDNGSDEPGVAAWAATLAGSTAYRSEVNLLFAEGCNTLARLSQAQKLLFLNQDTVAPAGLANELHRLDEETCLTFAQQFPWSDNPLIPFLSRNGAFLWRTPSAPVEPTNVVSGGAFAIHRDTIERRLAGQLFDPRIPHYGEDIHLSLRLRRAGVRILASSSSPLPHDSSPSVGNHLRDFQRAIRIQRNTLRAFVYDLGWRRFALRFPRFLAGAWEKADVDGQGTPIRRIGLVGATMVALLGVFAPAKPVLPGQVTRYPSPSS